MRIYGPKLEPRSKLGHENRRALEHENSAESETLQTIVCKQCFSAKYFVQNLQNMTSI